MKYYAKDSTTNGQGNDSIATSSASETKQSKWPLFISLFILAVLIGGYFFWPAFHEFFNTAYQVLISDDQQKIAQWVSQFGAWGPLLIILAMIAQMFLFIIPSVLVMVVTILAYGPFWGSALVLAGVLTASSLGYAIGAYLGVVAVSKLIGNKTEQKIETYVEKYGLWAVIIARMSPVLSNDATSFVGGLLRMGFWKFIGATLIGILPLTLGIAYLGGNIERLKTGLIWVSAISLLGFGLYIIYDQRKNKRESKQA